MNNCFKTFLATLFLCMQVSSFLSAQTIIVKNNSGQTIANYTLEIPAKELKLSAGNYMAEVEGTNVPLEIITNIKGEQLAILPVGKMNPHSEMTISLMQGIADNYPKRTYAELSHKIGGQFEGHKYIGGYSWVKPN